MAVFGIPTGNIAYPGTKPILIFGAEVGNQDFVVPMAKFTFYDAKGEALGGTAPVIYIRLGGTFNTQLSTSYHETTGIMGSPTGTSIFEGEAGKALGRLGSSFIEGIQKQIVQGVAGATGYVASAGQSGKSQVEFLQRVMLNNFQQLIYQGPTFRRFQLPFIMKPHSQVEAETMVEIISSFRVASSPRAGAAATQSISDTINTLGRRASVNELQEGGDAVQPDPKNFESTGGKESPEYIEAVRLYVARISQLTTAEETAADTIVNNSGQVFTFGYPDMCKFDLVLYRKGTGELGGALTPLFRSELCMIETVSVDYGSQNKMTFFDGKTNGTQYFPTDVNLTISLRESVLITASKAFQQYDSGTVIV